MLTRLSLYLMIPPACLTYIYRKTDHSKSQFSHRRTETNLSLFFPLSVYNHKIIFNVFLCVCILLFSFSVPSFFQKIQFRTNAFMSRHDILHYLVIASAVLVIKRWPAKVYLLRRQRNSVQRLTHFHRKRSNYYWLSRWPGMRCCLGGGLVLAALTCLNRVSQRLYCILLNVHIYLINFCRIRIRKL